MVLCETFVEVEVVVGVGVMTRGHGDENCERDLHEDSFTG